jgi:hypothetical protein
MDFPVDGLEIIDNGGTRSGRDRRKLTKKLDLPKIRGCVPDGEIWED